MAFLRASGLVLLLAALTACVTINIYFPAAQAERAAERIVDDILKQAAPKEQPEAAPQRPSSLPDQGGLAPLRDLFEIGLNWLVPPSVAAAPDFNIETPQIRSLRASMKARHQQLEPFYRSGAIGFSHQGASIATRDGAAVPLRQRKLLQTLVAEENADRAQLYRAIADANGQPQWEAQVRDVFAETWIKRAPSGWWYRDRQGQWRQK